MGCLVTNMEGAAYKQPNHKLWFKGLTCTCLVQEGGEYKGVMSL